MLACTPPPNDKGLLVGCYRKLLFCDLGSDLQELVDVLEVWQCSGEIRTMPCWLMELT